LRVPTSSLFPKPASDNELTAYSRRRDHRNCPAQTDTCRRMNLR
jgi:hypothetical protein